MSTDRKHTIISTDAAPAAVGAYSQAIRAGDLMFLSGQIPLDPQTKTIVGEGDVAAQTRQVLKNLLAVVEAGGYRVDEIVRCGIFLKDMGDFAVVNGIYEEALAGHRPARATVEVARLPRDVLVEIDAICAKAT